MQLKEITLKLTDEELEAIHYVMEIGIKEYKKSKSHVADDWIEKAEDIRKKLPIKMRLGL